MKILKRAIQRNFEVNDGYYTDSELLQLINENIVSRIVEDNLHSYYCVFTNKVKEVKVKLDEYGYYVNVAVLKDGTEIIVVL